MLGENWSDISYKNMFKNIAMDGKNAIHSKYKQTRSNLIDSIFGVIGKETSGNAIRRGIGLARIYKDNPEYVSHYLKQALVDSIPGGAGAALQIIRGVHRSVEPINTFKSALERVLAARLGEGKIQQAPSVLAYTVLLINFKLTKPLDHLEILHTKAH